MPSSVQPPITPYTRPTAKRVKHKKTADQDATVKAAKLTAELTAERDHYYLTIVDLTVERDCLRIERDGQKLVILCLWISTTAMLALSLVQLMLYLLHR